MKRYIFVTAVVLSVALLAAGCRGGQNEPTSMPLTKPTTVPTTQETTHPATQATTHGTQPDDGTGLPGSESTGGAGTGTSDPIGQDNARRAMPRGY